MPYFASLYNIMKAACGICPRSAAHKVRPCVLSFFLMKNLFAKIFEISELEFFSLSVPPYCLEAKRLNKKGKTTKRIHLRRRIG